MLGAEDARLLDELIAARRWDIYRDGFEDAGHFTRYIDQTSGHLMWVAARLLGAPDEAEPIVRDAGYASGLAAWFRAVPALFAEGRVPLLDPSPDAIAELATSAIERLSNARRNQSAIPSAAAPALWPALTADAALKQARRHPEAVLTRSIEPRLSPFRLAVKATRGRW